MNNRFGGVGDGTTSNTQAFKAAVNYLSQYSSDGGGQLYVPPGRWLTGSFNLTTHFTLYLDKEAVLLGSQVTISFLHFRLNFFLFCRCKGRTTIVPVTSLNTDGINSDSCTNTKIEDYYIVSGDDCVVVKSGWDEYGIAFGMPTKQLVIRRLTWLSLDSAVIALGSEMSGVLQDVRAEDITAINSESGVRIKTAMGRGGFVKDIYVRDMKLSTMKWAFWMTGNYGSHPDHNYDPNAIPLIQNINYHNMVVENVTMASRLEGISGEGISGDPLTGICISNVTIGLAQISRKLKWNCTDIVGVKSIRQAIKSYTY
ncbi:hypothetical protein K2173_022606 [Erythroxylum novogranatense]|uniref:Pectate lyase superfamily protein domain-containing protein n=1 Tax=Erythroxylum novogranatense TaxID=1862640 RepID=A0AAV8TPY3_9ROSI|nr:hypothetical protein K2173_022606 [Erythroxylum novogranatense]